MLNFWHSAIIGFPVVIVLDGFHGDEILLTSHETLSFSLLAMSAKLMIFNATKLSMKLLLRLA